MRKPQRTKIGRFMTRRFDSVDEMMREASKIRDTWKLEKHFLFHHKTENFKAEYFGTDNHSFLGRALDSWEHVTREVGPAWQEGIDIIERIRSKLGDIDIPQVRSIRRRPKWRDDGGDEVDMDRLRAGQDFWRSSVREALPGGTQNITVVANASTGFDKAPESVFWRGAAAILLTDILEEAGYRVDLWGGEYVRGAYEDGTDFCAVYKLKGEGDPVVVGNLATALSGWFYRTVVFQSHGLNDRGSSPTSTLGAPTCFNLDYVSKLIDVDKNELITVEKVWSEEQAATWVQTNIEKVVDGCQV